MTQAEPDEFLTVREVAEILKIRPETVRAEINAGRLTASRVGPKGGIMRISRGWVREYLDQQKISVSPKH